MVSYTALFYHIVFSTKERRSMLSQDILPRVCQYMGGIARNLKGQILVGNGAPDHIHLLGTIPATATVAEFVGKVKANATGWIHETQEDLREFAWQDGYAAFSVSPSVLPHVKQYIRTQQEHHRKMSFQEELVVLLEKHGVEYDKRYIWK